MVCLIERPAEQVNPGGCERLRRERQRHLVHHFECCAVGFTTREPIRNHVGGKVCCADTEPRETGNILHPELAARESVAVVPLALPLMAGPGAISSSIVYASQSTWSQMLGMSVVVMVFAFCSWLIFRAAPLLFKVMGDTGINVVTRIMGLIMMSLGIEIMVAGIKGVFPGLM